MNFLSWLMGLLHVFVHAHTSNSPVGSSGQIEEVTDYPVQSNEVCVWEEERRRRRGRWSIQKYIFMSSLVWLLKLPTLNFTPLPWMWRISSALLCLTCFCSVKTQEKHTLGVEPFKQVKVLQFGQTGFDRWGFQMTTFSKGLKWGDDLL